MGIPRLPLLWRVFAINAGLLLAGTLVLALAPGRIHARIAVVETLDLVIGLTVMIAANLFLLRQALAPVARLVERMRTVDAVTPMTGLVVPFTAFVLVYLFLSAAVVVLLRDQFRETT